MTDCGMTETNSYAKRQRVAEQRFATIGNSDCNGVCADFRLPGEPARGGQIDGR